MITYTKKVSFNSVNASCFEVQPCPLWATVVILSPACGQVPQILCGLSGNPLLASSLRIEIFLADRAISFSYSLYVGISIMPPQ